MSRAERDVANSVAEHLRSKAKQAGWATDPVAWANDVLGVHLWSKQQEICRSVMDHKRTVVASCHGTGKALDVDTPIPVPGGQYVPMGEIVPGMQVLGSDGSPVYVVASTGIHTEQTYRILLDGPNGRTEIVASGDHIWSVLDSRQQAQAMVKCSRSGMPGTHWGLWHHRAKEMTTRELFRVPFRNQQHNILIPTEIPQLRHPNSDSWVSDKIRQLLATHGCLDSEGRPALSWHSRVRSLDKRPPRELTETRELLRSRGVHTLLRRERERHTVTWTLALMPRQAADLLPNSDDRAVARTRLVAEKKMLGPSGWRIVDVQKADERRVQCIQVDALDHMYLCGEERIPTHNSMIASVIACWWVSTRPLGEAIVVSSAPTYQQVNKILWEEIRKHHSTARRRGMPLPGKVTLGDEWKDNEGKVLAFGRKPADGDRHGFQGIHRRYVLAIGDEACHDDQTDVLTESGWKRFKDVLESDRLLTMNKETHLPYYDLPVRLIDKPYSGDLIFYEGKGMNYAVTPDHAMLYGQRQKDGSLSWRTSEHQEMTSWRNKAAKKVIDWDTKDLPVLSDDFISLLGWFGAEGNFPSNPNEIRIYQLQGANLSNYLEISGICDRLGLKHSLDYDHVRIFEPALREMLLGYGKGQLQRRVPSFVRKLSRRQIDLYLEAFWKGDGYLHESQKIIYTSSSRMADDLQELLLKIGVASVVRIRDLSQPSQPLKEDGRCIQATTDGFVVTWPIKGSELAWPKEYNVRRRHYEGRVYCATMPRDHLLFTRRNGYTMWSGNCGLPEEIWTGIEAITTSDLCRMLFIGNPDDRNTEFGTAFLNKETEQDWNRISVPASCTPNFTGEEVPPALNEVLVSRAWAEERKRNWGVQDARYISKVLARFPDASESSLFPPSVVAQAFEDVPPQPMGQVLRLGVDVARFGTDETVVISHVGRTAKVESTWSGTDTVSSAHQVLHIAEEAKKRLKSSWVEIRVDAVGLGAGVVDTLNARAVLEERPWFSVYEMHGSASPPVEVGGSVHGYGNARAYWFDQLRQSMRNGNVRMEENQQIRDDLGLVFYLFRNGRLFIIPKEEMRTKHGRSPDYADALAYATAPLAQGLQVGETVSEDMHTMLDELDDFEDERELTIAPF